VHQFQLLLIHQFVNQDVVVVDTITVQAMRVMMVLVATQAEVTDAKVIMIPVMTVIMTVMIVVIITMVVVIGVGMVGIVIIPMDQVVKITVDLWSDNRHAKKTTTNVFMLLVATS
jgi:hypothetical protein